MRWVLTRAKKKDCIIHSERKTIYDKFGIDRLVNFIQLYKVEKVFVTSDQYKQVIKRNRLFFKDYTGALNEVPQSKGVVKKHELVKLRKELGHIDKEGNMDSNVTGHGVVLNVDELDRVIISTDAHLDAKKQDVIEKMNDMVDKHSNNNRDSNSGLSRRFSQNSQNVGQKSGL